MAEKTRTAGRPAKRGGGTARTLHVEQYRSGIACPQKHRRTLRALGLRRMWQRVQLPDNPAVRGMLAAIPHLARVVEDSGDGRK